MNWQAFSWPAVFKAVAVFRSYCWYDSWNFRTWKSSSSSPKGIESRASSSAKVPRRCQLPRLKCSTLDSFAAWILDGSAAPVICSHANPTLWRGLDWGLRRPI